MSPLTKRLGLGIALGVALGIPFGMAIQDHRQRAGEVLKVEANYRETSIKQSLMGIVQGAAAFKRENVVCSKGIPLVIVSTRRGGIAYNEHVPIRSPVAANTAEGRLTCTDDGSYRLGQKLLTDLETSLYALDTLRSFRTHQNPP